MAQEFYKNNEHESEFESQYDDSASDSKHVNIESESDHGDIDSDYDNDNENNPKRRKIGHNTEEEVLLTDKDGHIKCNPGQLLGPYEIGSVLGEGAFGRVLAVKNVKTGQNAALKVIKNEQTKRKAAMAEIITLTIISSRDPANTSLCINMLSWFTYAGHVCIAFPALGVSIFDFLKDNDFEPYSIDEVRHISYQLSCAVLFLHKNGITHTDLKPENILFVNSSFTTVYDEERNLELRRINCTDIRLIDFGSVVRDNEYHHPIITTRYYRAPAVILKLDWTHSSDVWSIGCILIEIYFGNLLFPYESDREHLVMMEKTIGAIPMQMISASKTHYFINGKLKWTWDDAEEDSKEYCRPLNQFRLADGEDHHQLFSVIEQMLEYEPDKRLQLSAALVQPFFDKLPVHQRISTDIIK